MYSFVSFAFRRLSFRLLDIIQTEASISFSVRVIPRSAKAAIVGEYDGVLKIKLKSPPINGAANDELIRFLAKLLDVSRPDVEIVAGATSRTKRIRIKSSETAQIAAILRAKI